MRGKGLFAAIELVKDKETGERLVPWTLEYHEKKHPVMEELLAKLKEEGVHTYSRWNVLMVAPPLCITEQELTKGLGKISIGQFFIVADRGMMSAETVKELKRREIPYILGTRMRKVNEVKRDVLSCQGRYRQVRPEGKSFKDPAPLEVKEALVNGSRYIVCLNPRQVRKDAQDRQAILESLKEKVKAGPKSLVGNKGYRKYLKIERGSVSIDQGRVEYEARFDGKWGLMTTTEFSADQVALKYKELWQVEQVFRDIKSVLETRPVYHQRDETIRGHVFCSFLVLVLRKEPDRRLEEAGHSFEWADIKQDLKALQEVLIEDGGKSLALRTECVGTFGKVFQAVGVAIPPTIREVKKVVKVMSINLWKFSLGHYPSNYC